MNNVPVTKLRYDMIPRVLCISYHWSKSNILVLIIECAILLWHISFSQHTTIADDTIWYNTICVCALRDDYVLQLCRHIFSAIFGQNNHICHVWQYTPIEYGGFDVNSDVWECAEWGKHSRIILEESLENNKKHWTAFYWWFVDARTQIICSHGIDSRHSPASAPSILISHQGRHFVDHILHFSFSVMKWKLICFYPCFTDVFVFKGLLDIKSSLVQVMVWCRTSDYRNQCWPTSMSLYGITWPTHCVFFIIIKCCTLLVQTPTLSPRKHFHEFCIENSL